MRIVHISTVHDTFDDRIFHKECVSLASAGFETHLIVQHTKPEVVKGVEIHPLRTYRTRLDRIYSGNREAGMIAKKLNADVYHLHDPELIPLGIKLKKSGYKVIYDMHELVYHTIMLKKWIPLFLRWIVGKLYLEYEKKAFHLFDHFIVVTSQMKDEYISKSYPKQLKNTSVLRNLTILEMVNKAEAVKTSSPNQVLIYAGGLSPERGIKEVIQAIQSIENVHFWLLGPWSDEHYQQECESVDKKGKMIYHGMVDLEKVYNYMKGADIGMAVLHPTKNHLASLPVKSFEYMAAGIPQIMSDFPFWKNSFSDCALFVSYDNVDLIEQAIRKLLSDEKLAKKMGNNGYDKVRLEYSWEKESQKLIEIYNRI